MLLLGVVLPIVILIVLAGVFTVAYVAANMSECRAWMFGSDRSSLQLPQPHVGGTLLLGGKG